MTGSIFKVVRVASLSRAFVLALQVLFNLLPDHAADAFNPVNEDEYCGVADFIIRSLLDGFQKWDAKYFLHIARYGYQEEQMFAFFPLFPLTLRALAFLVQLIPGLSYHSCLLVAGVVLNALFFLGAAVALYKLTLRIFNNESFAYVSAVVFSFNPASIFFSTNYTESLYSCCVFWGLFYLECGSMFRSTVVFTCAAATRSNGIINVGFPIYLCIQSIIYIIYEKESLGIARLVKLSVCNLLKTLIIVLSILLPFVAFNFFGYRHFCYNQTYLQSDRAEWCYDSIPLLYSHVQRAHWGIGLFNYYKFRKLPNIALAVPCMVITIFGVVKYLKYNTVQAKTLGLQTKRGWKPPTAPDNSLFYCLRNIFVHVVHVSALFMFGLLFMHVEVITRFLFSSSPFLVWVSSSMFMRDVWWSKLTVELSDLTMRQICTVWKLLSFSSQLISVYFVCYTVIGALLHVNFLPWT